MRRPFSLLLLFRDDEQTSEMPRQRFADLLCGGCYAEMRGQNELMIQGCRKIAVYTEEEIFLLLRRGGIRVRGRRLTCISYHAGKIEIRGWITGIDFRNTEGTL